MSNSIRHEIDRQLGAAVDHCNPKQSQAEACDVVLVCLTIVLQRFADHPCLHAGCKGLASNATQAQEA